MLFFALSHLFVRHEARHVAHRLLLRLLWHVDVPLALSILEQVTLVAKLYQEVGRLLVLDSLRTLHTDLLLE